MKYMGSKRSMLTNGLGQLLLEQAPLSNRVFDPFSGSASVVWFLAEKTNCQIVAGDLQKYSTDLANALLLRNAPLTDDHINALENWVTLAKTFHETIKIDLEFKKTKKCVFENRRTAKSSCFNLTNAYGGYYFSVDQALKIDSLLYFVPEHEPIESLAITGLIDAGSQCVASPGHTAQPFQPDGNGLISIMEAWKRDPFHYVERKITDLVKRHANRIGIAKTSNAIDLLDMLEEGDLVFLDPPYSGVHYSRFYHVLETISRNSWVDVSGTGRYPDPSKRPISDFSKRGTSIKAFDDLLNKISSKKAKAIITFPSGDCSNALSGDLVKTVSKKYFKVKRDLIKSHFSTMGGNTSNRPARVESNELVLLLEPK